jgi:hypothetical protein
MKYKTPASEWTSVFFALERKQVRPDPPSSCRVLGE